MKIRFIGLIDQPNMKPVKIALFGEAVETCSKVDEVIRVSGVYGYIRKKKTPNGTKNIEDKPSSLGMSRASMLEVLSCCIALYVS